MFIEYLKEDRHITNYSIFYEKIKKQKQEWENSDLVVDSTETWKNWLNRQINFENAPLVPRSQLPENKKPENNLYAKLACKMYGIEVKKDKENTDS